MPQTKLKAQLERYQTYLIVGLAILLASFAFLPPSLLPKWIADPGDIRFFGWFMLTGLCLGAMGMIRDWANRRKTKWLLAFGVVPLAVLSYEAWFIFKKVALDVRHNWRIYFFVLWIVLTYYLWERGNEYKRQLEQERFVGKPGAPGS